MLAWLVPRTIRGRLALTHAALIVAVMMALGLFVVVSVRHLYVDRVYSQLAAQARLVAAAVAPSLATGGGVATIDPLVKRLGRDNETHLTVIAADGRVLGDSVGDPTSLPNQAGRAEVREARRLRAGATPDAATRREGADLLAAVTIPGSGGAVARVALPVSVVDAAMHRIQLEVVLAAVAAAALAAAVAVVVARRITEPLDDLRRQAAAVSAGRLDVAVTPTEPREFSAVARSFNLMTARVRELVEESDRSRSRLEAVFATLSDGVIFVDEQGVVLGLNAAASRMLGADERRAIGQPFVVVARDHDLVGLLRRGFEANAAQTALIDFARGGRKLDAVAQPVAGTGERLGIVVIRDVTDLRRLESVRREFVANVSHELRTPLASIRALVETLEAGAIGDPDVAGDFLGRIVGEVDRLAALVDELLDLARLESGRMPMRPEAIPPIDLLTKGTERLRPQIERAGLRLVVDVSPDLPRVLVDRGRIEQVLLNLVHNAIKFTPAGGTIAVGAVVEDRRLRVAVSDTGVGIPDSELPRIFERFYKADKARRTAGTGLGLAITKHIVEAHRGTIAATSVPGQGATFTFTLPLALAAPAQVPVIPANGALTPN